MATRPPRRETEQGTPPRREPEPTPAQRLREQGWFPPDWELADASAVKGLMAGTASPEQQRRAMDWILRAACGLQDWAFRPDERGTAVMLGRQFVGHQIMKLAKIDLPKLERREPRADVHEPRT